MADNWKWRKMAQNMKNIAFILQKAKGTNFNS